MSAHPISRGVLMLRFMQGVELVAWSVGLGVAGAWLLLCWGVIG